MNRRLFVLLVVLSITALTACEAQQPSPAVVGSEAPVAQEKAAENLDLLSAWQKLMTIRKTTPIDFEAIRLLYEANIAAFVREVDQQESKQIDLDIVQAIAAGTKGQDANYHAQIVDKLTQYAGYLAFVGGWEMKLKGKADESIMQRLEQSVPIVRAATMRRSQWVDKGDQYPSAFDAATKKLGELVAQGQTDQAQATWQELENLLNKVYVLSVFYELGGLLEARGDDEVKASEKIAETRVYYRFVASVHQQRNPDGAKTVNQQLAKPIADIDVDLIRQILRQDFTGELTDIKPSLLGG